MKEYKELRIAIIGCGMISHRHMTVIENLNKKGNNLRVVAAAEIDKEKLEKWGGISYGIALYIRAWKTIVRCITGTDGLYYNE